MRGRPVKPIDRMPTFKLAKNDDMAPAKEDTPDFKQRVVPYRCEGFRATLITRQTKELNHENDASMCARLPNEGEFFEGGIFFGTLIDRRTVRPGSR